MNDSTINIRDIQHYLYCPRRFSLMEINKDWAENYYVIKANLLHEHVHDGSHSFSDKTKIVRSDIDVFNDLPEYNLFGVTDCIEFLRDPNGISITGSDEKFRINIIEYKPKAPKGILYNEPDVIQVFAQKICADYVWKCNSEAYIYYSDTRKRIKLPFDEEYEKYDSLLKELLREMRKIMNSNHIISKKKNQKCAGCSLSDKCIPKSTKYCVKDIVMSQKEEAN